MESHEEKKKIRTINIQTSNLEIPAQLAYLFERCDGVPPMHTERNWVPTVGRVPLFPSAKHDLPPDIDNYVLPRFFRDYGINFDLGFKTAPLESPIVPKSTGELTKKSLDAFKLILRFVFDDTMTEAHEHLIGNYIVHLAMQNLELREEIYLQVMNQCVNYNDEVGLKRLWLLIANLLSACKPGDRIENYVTKFVSDHGIHEWNTLCQTKILAARPQCRLFPPCSLEWKSNKKHARVALPVSFIDGQSSSTLDIDSFTNSEEFAKHALSIRSDSKHGLSGWSVALQFNNEIIEMGGHGYVLDPFTCAELGSEWTSVGGSSGNMFFLISKTGRHASNSDANSAQSTDPSGQGNFLKPGVHPTRLMAIESPRANMRSAELDSWLEDVFDQALTNEQTIDSRQVQGWIHGLGDQMPIPNMNMPGAMGMPIMGAAGVAPNMGMAAPMMMMPDPMAQAQTAQLQTAIQQAQLQNTLLQHNVQREMLVSQLNQLQVANQNQQYQNQQVPAQLGAFRAASPPQAPAPQMQFSGPQLRQAFPQQQQQQQSRAQPPLRNLQMPARSSPPQQSSRSPLSDVYEDHDEEPSNSMNHSANSFGNHEPGTPDSDPMSASINRRGSGSSDPASRKDRARTVRIGKVSWPPPVAESGVPDKQLPEPKRLPMERDHQKLLSQEQRPKRETPPVKVTASVSPSPVVKSSEPTTPKVDVRRQEPRPSTSRMDGQKESLSPSSPTPGSTKVVRSSVSSNENNAIPVRNQKMPASRRLTPVSHSSPIVLTEQDFETESNKRRDDVPHVDVADRARKLASQLFRGNPDVAVTEPSISRGKDQVDGLEKWFAGHHTRLLDATDARHYMYTLVPWSLMVRKEIFSPDERMENPMLLDLLFTQIVYDVLKQPCIRLSTDEKKKLKNLIDEYEISVNIDSMKKQSKQVKKIFLDAAKSSQFYFGRFYAAEWHAAVSHTYAVHWVMVNHVGVHLVHLQEDGVLKALKSLPFEEIHSVTKMDSRVLSISTKDNDRYDLVCHMVVSLKNLIDSYLVESERMRKTAIVRRESSLARNRLSTDGVVLRNSNRNSYQPHEADRKSGATRLIGLDEIDDIINYGMSYFKDNSRARVEESLRWSKAPLQTSLHPFDEHSDEKHAVEAHFAILTFMHDYPMEVNTTMVDYALILFEIPMRRKILVDEIYCQLIKQTRPVDSENPTRVNLLSCWRLFTLFAMFFDCSDNLRPYLMRYLHAVAQKEEFEGVVSGVLKNLDQTQRYGGRKLLPLRGEMEAEIEGFSAKRFEVRLPGQIKAALQMTPISVIDEVIDELCNSYGVTDDMEKNEYTVFAVIEKENISSPLRGEQYVYDVLTDLTGGKRAFHFYFCRTCWVADLQVRDRMATLIDILYREVIDDYMLGNWLLVPIGNGVVEQANDIVRLAAIQHKIKTPFANTISHKEMKTLLPKGLNQFQNLKDNEWHTRSKAQLKQLVKNTSVECKAEALNILNKWFLFGGMCFNVRTAMRSVVPDQTVLLCLCRPGLILMHPVNHRLLLNVSYHEIFSYEVTIDPNGPSQLDLKIANDQVIRCFTNQGNKIVHVLNQYMKLTNGN